jgi:uncharacterized protein (DUF1499 family)
MKSLPVVLVLSLILAVAGALVAVASGFGHRLQLWGYLLGFKILLGATVAAALGALLAVVSIYLSWRGGDSARLYASLVALLVGLAVLAPVVSAARAVRAVPRIHDISTDTENPPLFVAILKERANAPNTANYGGPEVAKLQHAGYPDLKPLNLPVPPPRTFEAALAAARALGWKIVATDPAAGRIEASDQTFWFGFIDDVVVRVTPTAAGSRVDVRSVSRVGKSDLGANARRIRKFLADLSQRAGSAG